MTELDLKGKKRLDFARDLFLFSFYGMRNGVC